MWLQQLKTVFNILDFLNGFRRFEDESVSAGGKFIYRMSGEIGVFVVPWFLYPISYRPIPKALQVQISTVYSPISVNY